MNEQTQNDGGPFAPYFKRMETIDGVTKLDLVHGCTMRDYFAGHALTGYIANPQACAGLEAAGKNSPEIYAMLSYAIADAMLKARAAK